MIVLPKTILDFPVVKNILEQSMPIEGAVTLVRERLKLDFEFEKNEPKDMVTLLQFLAEKNAIVVIPEYESLSGGYTKENEVLISNKNRHGKVIGVAGNNTNFSFTIKIIDANVIESETIGVPRAFRITDPEGNKYKGMEKFQIVSKIENFKKMEFGSFVSAERWTELFTENYFLSKLLMKRLTMESKHYYGQIKNMLAEGITFPKAKSSSGEYYHAKGVKKNIKAFIVDVNVPGLHKAEQEFPEIEFSQENLINLTQKRNAIIYKIVPRINFITRVIEFSYFKFNKTNTIPKAFKDVWGDVSWQPMKIGKTIWDCLKLSNGLEIRKREYEMTERMIG